MKYLSNWSTPERDAAKAYEDTLSSLKDNSKPVINTLTELANEYGREFPHVIVSCIEERIKEVSHFNFAIQIHLEVFHSLLVFSTRYCILIHNF